MLSRGRLERGNPALVWQTHVRHHHCIGRPNAVVKRQDPTRRLRQRAKHARHLRKRLRRDVLTIARTNPAAVTNDEWIARRDVAGCHEMTGGESTQQ